MAIATPNNMAGYDNDKLSDNLICIICRLPSRDPYLSVCCGHLFCKSCLDNVKKCAAIARAGACPMCCDEEFVTFPNKAVDREIKSRVYCTNKVKGCEWKGELKNINDHLGNSDGCEFEEVKCPIECGKLIERRYLTSHVETECPHRKVNCQYCHDIGEYQFIEGQHKEECPKLPLPCPNKCEVGSVSREDMEAHRKECPLETIQCEYHNVGCEVRMARKDQEKHKKENMEEHLMKTNLALQKTKLELADFKYDTTITLTYISSQLDVALQRINTLEALVPLTALTDEAVTLPTTNAVIIMSSLRWSVKLAAMLKMSESGDQQCPVILRLSEFNKQKENKVKCYSNSFFTHHKGYKMCLCIYPAGYGDGKGTHLSWFVHLMKGPHDDELTWPFRGKFEVKLLNQISDSHHHSMSMPYNDSTPDNIAGRVTEGDRARRGRGRYTFISNENLHKTTKTCQFLKDDCLFLQVTKF